MEFQPRALLKTSEIETLLRDHRAEFLDLVPAQTRELFIIRHLNIITDRKQIPQMPEFKKFTGELAGSQRTFYYPWLNKIIRTVDEEDFFILKTNRNRDLITEEEQRRLKEFSVVVLGMSVGSNIAFLLTQAGFSNRIYLADPDTLDTTNLNRIFTGLQDLELNKTVLAARKIYESNPFADVHIMPEGINENNLEELLRKKEVDCIVEEVDSMPVKIAVRKQALQHRIPVVMVTDNGFSAMLHAERYDLGLDKIFEQDPASWDERLRGLDFEKLSRIIIENVFGGVEEIDPRLFASNQRIFKKELVAWPQLGSTAMLGAAIALQAVKKIALGEPMEPFTKKHFRPEL